MRRAGLIFVFRDEFKLRLKRVIKTIDVIKILTAVGVAFPHLLNSNQIVNQLTEVTGRMDPPVRQNDFGKVAILTHLYQSHRV